MEVACGEHGDVLLNLVVAVETGKCSAFNSHEKSKEGVPNGSAPGCK